ncbi:MAG: hypothetical protein QM811_28685 [Pirellulales bacterium]
MIEIATLHVGGVIAIGFDSSGRYAIVVSHSGRGVYDTQTWLRVARDNQLAYPDDGIAEGIGPLSGQQIKVIEEYYGGTLIAVSPNKEFEMHYLEGTIEVFSTIH